STLVSIAQILFPRGAPAARLLRQPEARNSEHLTLLSSAQPDKLYASRWLQSSRAGFGGIENGLHQRLDVSHNDDLCRIRSSPAMFFTGLFRRISNRLLME